MKKEQITPPKLTISSLTMQINNMYYHILSLASYTDDRILIMLAELESTLTYKYYND